MTLLLVRHAIALRRRDWARPDELRPLTPKGYQQAEGLIDPLREFTVVRILSSPFVRCVETVEPMALRLGLAVEALPALGEGAGDEASRLGLDRGDGAVVLCSHGDVIPDLLQALAPKACVAHDLPCAKGSTWVVEGEGVEATARYLPPPDVA